MKIQIIFGIMVLIAIQSASGLSFMAENLDRINVDAYLGNRRIVEYHIACGLGRGPCDRVGLEMKRMLPIVGRGCLGCSSVQKTKLEKIARHVQTYYPQAFNELNSLL